jgi:hypothetical protein
MEARAPRTLSFSLFRCTFRSFNEDPALAFTPATSSTAIGFLTVLHESTGYMGGYLVTNQWGRPLEFRLSTAVQPNRVQQILYGGTLRPYICGDLIGKTLVDKTSAPAQLIFTDTESALDLRLRVECPVAWVTPAGILPGPEAAGTHATLCVQRAAHGAVFHHSGFPQDAIFIREVMDRFDGSLDLNEPFARIREAINEGRKMGIGGRAAA